MFSLPHPSQKRWNQRRSQSSAMMLVAAAVGLTGCADSPTGASVDPRIVSSPVTATMYPAAHGSASPIVARGEVRVLIGEKGMLTVLGASITDGPSPLLSGPGSSEDASGAQSERQPVHFGRPFPSASFGQPSVPFEFASTLVSTQMVDGRRIELFAVPKLDRRPGFAGLVLHVDGVIRQMYEFDEGRASDRAKSVRIVSYDATGRQVADMAVDVSRMRFTEKAQASVNVGSRVLAACGALAGRVASGVADALLPSMLHAQVEPDCEDEKTAMVVAGIALAGAGAAFEWALGLCPITGVTCAAAVPWGIAAATAGATYYYLVYRYGQCRGDDEPCNGEMYCEGEGPGEAMTGGPALTSAAASSAVLFPSNPWMQDGGGAAAANCKWSISRTSMGDAPFMRATVTCS